MKRKANTNINNNAYELTALLYGYEIFKKGSQISKYSCNDINTFEKNIEYLSSYENNGYQIKVIVNMMEIDKELTTECIEEIKNAIQKEKGNSKIA